MSSSSPFILLRATATDTQSLASLMYTSFSTIPVVQELIMGCDSASDTYKTAELFSDAMSSDPTDIWIKIVDNESGQLVAASRWKLYLTPGGGEKMVVPDWLNAQKKERARELIEGMNNIRMRNNEGEMGYLYLHICMTDPEYQRRGLGRMMLEWGCRLADILCISAYVEASPDGQGLYRKYGFEEAERVVFNGEVVGMHMRRKRVVGQ